MGLGQLLHDFAQEKTVQIILLVLIADFFLGIIAALKQNSPDGRNKWYGTFRFSYIGDYLKTDVLGKVVPYFILWTLGKVAGDKDLVIPGLDFAVLAGAAYATLIVAFVGSILSSLKHMGVGLSDVFAGEKPPPGP